MHNRLGPTRNTIEQIMYVLNIRMAEHYSGKLHGVVKTLAELGGLKKTME